MNVVAHNLPSMFTNRQLGITTNNKAKSAEKLSSGYKINRAADDAAGLSISEKMRRQIRGLRQGADNIQDGISFCQTADGYLNEVVDMLHRMNELSIKAANGTNSASDRMDIDNEIQELKEETNRIFKTAKFNETYIFRLPYTPGVSVVRDYDENSTSLVKTSSKFPPGASLDSVSQSSGHMSNTFSKEGVTYKSASYIDFSGVDFSDISSLDGTGFFSTCCTCTNNYCVTFDSSSSDHTLVGNENYTYTVGTFGVSNASELIDRIVEATGGKPQDHYSIYEKDPTNGNILVIYDERPDQTAGDEYGKIYSGVVKEVTYRSQGEPMKIFSNGLRGGDISYGGIELNDVRHNWSEMGIDISSDGKTFAKDQQVSFYDYKGEYVELHVKAGDPLYQITRRNYWSADGKGVYVNDIFAASWKDIGIKEKNNNGDFSFQFRDQIISFEVNDGDNLEDVINGINARQLNTRNSWDITTSEVERGKALDLFDVNALRVTEANKDAFDYKYWISIYGNGTDDESGITITSSDGVEHTKTSWKDFENIASLGENDKYPISDWGITDRDNKGTKSDRVTFDDAATYKYVNKAQTDLNISFSFNLKDETGLDEGKAAINGVELKKTITSPNHMSNNSSGGSIGGKKSGSSLSISSLSFTEMKAYGRDFDDADATLSGTITRTFTDGTLDTENTTAINTNGDVPGSRIQTVTTSPESSSDSQVYLKGDDGKYYLTNKTVENYRVTETWTETITDIFKDANYKYNGGFANVTIDEVSKDFDYTRVTENTREEQFINVRTTYKTEEGEVGYTKEELDSKFGEGVWAMENEKAAESVTDANPDVKNHIIGTTINYSSTGSQIINIPSRIDGNPGFNLRITEGENTLGDEDFSIHFQADGFAYCDFNAEERGENSNNINDSVFLRKVNINLPEKELPIQTSANNPDYIPLRWNGLNNAIIGIYLTNTKTEKDAMYAIDEIGNAIKMVSDTRSVFGAQQNRLEHALKQNNNTAENTQAAESLIRDTDMASEMVKYSKESILQQAGQSMLTQANQQPRSILQLLQ